MNSTLPEHPQIDEATGMPVVPENHYWVVEEDLDLRLRGFSKEDRPTYYGCVRVILKKRQEVVCVQDKEVNFFWLIPMTWGQETVISENQIVLQQAYVKRDGLPDGVPATRLTPELVLKTALEVYENYRLACISRQLLGEYPPMRLPVVPDE